MNWLAELDEIELAISGRPNPNPDMPSLQELDEIEADIMGGSDTPDFVPGVKRGVDQLQASGYGAAALVGSAMEKVGLEDTGQAVQDWGIEGYKRNMKEAAKNPAKHRFIELFKESGVGKTIDWLQGTAGELLPSMAEAAIGTVIGTMVAPGAGSAVGGLAGRTILKKSINGMTKALVKDRVKKGLIKKGFEEGAEAAIRKEVTKQALKKMAGRAGMVGAVLPVEAGSMYADEFVNENVDAPMSALFFGSLSASLELAGGNSKAVDVLVDALAKGNRKTAKDVAKDILRNILEEGFQEGSQEVMAILNHVVNTDDHLLTTENLEQVIDSVGAGMAGGGMGGAGTGAMALASRKGDKQDLLGKGFTGETLDDEGNPINGAQDVQDDVPPEKEWKQWEAEIKAQQEAKAMAEAKAAEENEKIAKTEADAAEQAELDQAIQRFREENQRAIDGITSGGVPFNEGEAEIQAGIETFRKERHMQKAVAALEKRKENMQGLQSIPTESQKRAESAMAGFEERAGKKRAGEPVIISAMGQAASEAPIIQGDPPDIILTDFEKDKEKPYDPFEKTTNRLGGKVRPQPVHKQSFHEEVESVAQDVELSQINTEPTDAQKKAGNYKKGHIKVHGLEISVENPDGSVRKGTDSNGNKWESTMHGNYGYFKRSLGKDGDQVDVIVKPGALMSPDTFIVDQVDPVTGKFDEHKVIMGAESEEEAKALYMANYEDGWKGFGAITHMGPDDFKVWLKDGKRTKKAVKYVKPGKSNEGAVNEAGGGSVSETKDDLPKEKAIETFVNKIIADEIKRGKDNGLEATQEQIDSFRKDQTKRARSFVESIKNKDFQALEDRLHRGNKGSLKLFTEITGLPTTTQKATNKSIRALDPVKYDNWIDLKTQESKAAEHEAVTKAKAKAEKDMLLNKVVYLGETMTFEVYINTLLQTGYTNIEINDNGPFKTARLFKYENGPNGRKFFTELFKKKIAVDYVEKMHDQYSEKAFAESIAKEEKEMAENPDAFVSQNEADQLFGNEPKPSIKDQFVNFFETEFKNGTSFKNILTARKALSEAIGIPIAKSGTQDVKTVDEAIEAAAVKVARRSIKIGKKHNLPREEIFDILVELQNQMPNLSVRTSTSVKDQAYSTPLPLAFLASELAGIDNKTTVYEPSAGNGALLIGANPHNVTANELNDDRYQSLLDNGFAEVNQGDGTIFTPDKKQDVVIGNPPFGTVQDGRGRKSWFVAGQYNTAQIDHAMVFKSLEAMKKGGRAVFIVGSVNDRVTDPNGRKLLYRAGDKVRFYKTLYDQYNVVNHFTVAGKLYSKQGAAWPVDVIVIEGKGKSDLFLPGAVAPPYLATLDEVKGKLNETHSVDNTGTGESGADSGNGQASTGGHPDGNTSSSAPNGQAPGTNQPGTRPGSGSKEPGDSSLGSGDTVGDDSPVNENSGEGPAPGESTVSGLPGSTGDNPSGRTDNQDGPKGRRDTGSGKGDGSGNVSGQPDSSLSYGSKNKLFTKSAADKARELLKQKFSGNQLNSGLDPEIVRAGIQLAGYHIEAGARSFADFSKAMLKDIGDSIKPFLRSWYEGVRYYPGFNSDGMTSPQDIDSGRITPPAQNKAKKQKPKKKKKVTGTDSQVAYIPASNSSEIGTLTPVNMAEASKKALDNITQKHGSVDKYVADKLGYTQEEINGKDGEYGFFSGEQVDALALAINNIDNGTGFIIGDQTGVGKGRVVAAMMRFAMRNDLTPIFVTEKPNLYADMYRDFSDIGMADIADRILITNANETIPLSEDGKKVVKTKSNHTQILNKMADNGSLSSDYDVIFTTYNQMNQNGASPRRTFLETMASGTGMLIMDESHNAGGSSGVKETAAKLPRSIWFRRLIDSAHSAFYSSATYAKRPDTMDLYSKTDMKLAVDDIAELGPAIAQGGVPLQQAVAAMLVKAGQYVRRERSFEGVEYKTKPVKVNLSKAEDMSITYKKIFDFSNDFAEPAITGIGDAGAAGGIAISGNSAAGGGSITTTGFSSVMHNIISQSLLALKTQAAVDEAIHAFKENGQKPVITLANTMGSFIEQYAQENDLKPGDGIGLQFNDLLFNYLDKTRRYTERPPYAPANQTIRHYISDEELGPVGLAEYNRIKKEIYALDLGDIPVSPVDYAMAKLKEAGMTVEEITGRNHRIEYLPDGTQRYRIRGAKDKSIAAKLKTILNFNTDKTDALILNQSGSTGLSLHALPKWEGHDPAPRRMIILQAEANIDTHMQMLGRVHRAGQIKAPSYIQLMGDIPTEKRPAAVLSGKMASLNANTTAAKDSDMSAKGVVDFINKYGNRVVANIMADFSELHQKLGSPLATSDKTESGLEEDGAARKISGRIPLLPTVAEQEEIYDMIEAEYTSLIERLDASGQNDLEAKTYDLDAKVLQTATVFEGKAGSESPFTDKAVAEIVDMKRIGKSYSSKEVTTLLKKSVFGMTSREAMDTGKSLDDIISTSEETHSKKRDDALNTFVGYQIETLDDIEKEETRRATETRLNAVRSDWERIFYNSTPGSVLSMPINGTYFDTVVLSVEQHGKPKNPLALGTWRITVAVPDSTRRLVVPFSFVNRMESFENKGDVSEYSLAKFDRASQTAREERTIMTGNLLAAFAQFPRGRIINFKDSNKKVRQGILMPVGFDLNSAAKEKKVVLDTVDNVMKVLEEGIFIKSRRGDLSITPRAGEVILSVPSSKSGGSKYFLNEGLLSAVGGDFIKSGSRMRVTVRMGHARRVMDHLINGMDEVFENAVDSTRVRELLGIEIPTFENNPDRVENVSENEYSYINEGDTLNENTQDSTSSLYPKVGIQQTGEIRTSRRTVKSVQNAAEVLSDIGDSAQEEAYILTTDDTGKILRLHKYSKGHSSAATAQSNQMTGDILTLPGARTVYFVHNHPSGDMSESKPDRETFKAVKYALGLKGIDVKGIIIGADNYIQFDENGHDPARKILKSKTKKHSVPISERKIIERKEQSSTILNGSNRVLDRFKNEKDGILFTDPRFKELIFIPFKKDVSIKDATIDILHKAAEINADSSFINIKKTDGTNRWKLYNHLATGLESQGIKVRDIISQTIDGDAVSFYGSGQLYQPNAAGIKRLNSDEILYHTSNPQHSYGAAPGAGVTLKNVQAAFPGQTVGISPDGSIWVRTKGGAGLQIRTVKEIDGKLVLNTHAGRLDDQGMILGKYHKYEISLLKDLAGTWTLNHEIEHWLEDIGIIGPREQLILMSRVTSMGKSGQLDFDLVADQRENRANFIAQILADRKAQRDTLLGEVIQKISDFIDAVIHIARTSVRKIARGMESGKIYNKKGARGTGQAAPSYHAQTAAESDIIKEKFSAKPSLKEQMQEAKKRATNGKDMEYLADTAFANVFDHLHFIKKRLGDKSYQLHQLLTGVKTATFNQFLQHGPLHLDDSGVLQVQGRNQGVLPFLQAIGDDWQNLFYWIAAKRAEELDAQGRENWLDEDARKEIFEMVRDRAKNGQTWAFLNSRFQTINKNVLDIAEQAGLINPESRDIWESSFYIPFYRVMEDAEKGAEVMSGPKGLRKHISSQIKRLKGGEEKIGDPLENVLRNWLSLIDASARNIARANAAETGQELGIVEEVETSELKKVIGTQTARKFAVIRNGATRATAISDTEAEAAMVMETFRQKTGKKYFIEPRKETVVLFGSMAEKGIMSYRREGRPVYIKSSDPDLFRALAEIDIMQANSLLMKVLGKSKRLLTIGATITPIFRIRNMLRDTIHTSVVSGSFVPFLDTAKGFVKAMREDSDLVELMSSGFGFGASYVNAQGGDAGAASVKKYLKKEKGSVILDTSARIAKYVWDLWEKVGAASENAARVALYSNMRKKGATKLEAGAAARDLMDFSLHGRSHTAQFAIRVIPFLGARMQALSKLGRAAKENPKAFLAKAGLLTGVSLAIWAMWKDDERYKELENWDKWTYYHFWVDNVHVRIPKPFEIGALFSSMPETVANIMNGTEDGKAVFDWFLFTSNDVFGIDYLPQAIKPLEEVKVNYNRFTKRQIVPEYLKKLEPREQFQPWTPEVLKEIGAAFNISPLKLQHLIRGYSAALGLFVVDAADILLRLNGDYPDKPAPTLDEYGMGMFKRGQPARTTKYVNRFYELYQEMEKSVKTYRHHLAMGDPEKALAVINKNQAKIKAFPSAVLLRKRLSVINKKMRHIQNSKSMAAKKKREQMDKLTAMRNKLVQDLFEQIRDVAKQ